IKPQNILLTADHSTAKIADFGVARFSIADSPITRVGTNIYAPPEHSPLNLGRGTERLTAAADIYSLAKTVYTLLTRETPRSFANAAIDSLPEAARGEEWAEELLRVMKRATSDTPAERHQTVEEFWGDLAGVRDIAADGEYSTFVRTEPQPHVSRGYTPIAPAMPQFKPTGDLPPPVYTRPVYSPPVVAAGAVAGKNSEPIAVPIENATKPRRSRLRRLGVFAVSVVLFTGALYGTASYMRGRGAIPGIGSFFAQDTAVASTDIYLRASPSTENDPIGLVTKNSKVKIVNSRDNWYQVDVVEQGRVRPVAANATRGWLNGKYLEFTSN
ncbi:MAG: SH3 domain-containing protein, partial [Pyrinomonadaceae bacterium]